MPIEQWLEGVEDLIIRTPGLLGRLVEPNYEIAKASRIHYDFLDDADDVAAKRPFFVVREHEIAWTAAGDSGDVLYSEPVIVVGYTENVKWPDDHKRSKTDFVTFLGAMLQSIVDRQNKPIFDQPQNSYLPISRLQIIQQATRSRPYREDPNVAGTAYWWAAWVMHIGYR